MATSLKKSVIRSLSGSWVAGYLPLNGFLHGAEIELLGLDGKVAKLPVDGVKWIAWVRDFNSGDLEDPERLLRKAFAVRPRMPGLVIRLTLRGGDQLEGLSANDVTLIDPSGISLSPPDGRSNTQRLWIPRQVVTSFEVLAVIGAPKIGRRVESTATNGQESLF